MKQLCILIFLSLLITECFATIGETLFSKASPRTLIFLDDLKNCDGTITPALINKYNLMQINGVYYTGGMMLADKNSIDIAAGAWNAKIGTRVENIFSVKVPIDNLAGFVQDTSVIYFELDNKVYMRLDSVRSVTGVDLVQQGYNLPQGYSGKGVIFGDVDGGFDYTHPNFYDSTGTIYRVKRVWEQANNTGSSPAELGFGYGTEDTTMAAILSKKYSDTLASHATHVSGIAGGSGGGTHGRYRGMAFESDLVFVDFTNTSSLPYTATDNSATTSGIIDGISYVYTYAQSIGEPAVVNLSLGTHLGPHDGTSLFDQACDGLVGTGMILVGANGNEGTTDMHYSNNFGNDTATKISLVGFSDNTGGGYIDAWGDYSTDFCLNFYLTGKSNATGQICASQNRNTGNVTLINKAGDTCFIQLMSSATNPVNHKPEILVQLENTGVAKGDTLVIEMSAGKTGFNGTVHIWNAGLGDGTSFWGTSGGQYFVGNDNYTMGEIGGTGKSIISVGAFTSKDTFVNIAGVRKGSPVSGAVADIASFSSMGPTVDGRVKPDIAGPGNTVASSINSYDHNYHIPIGIQNIVDSTQQAQRTYSYAILQGTSMATPCVGGIAALLLQFNPNLAQSDIKTILEENAIRDQHVLSAGSTPNNVWGNGKVDAYHSMRTVTAVNDLSTSNLLIYPNPSQNTVTIVSASQPLQAQLFDITGRQVLTTQLSGGLNHIDVSALNKGVYLLKVQQADKVYCEKLVVD